MKKNKKISQKMIIFFTVLIVLVFMFIFNAIYIKSDEQGKLIIFGVIALSGVGSGFKFLDDWQRGKNFNKDFYNIDNEV